MLVILLMMMQVQGKYQKGHYFFGVTTQGSWNH